MIDRNPLGSVVTDPKRCQVTFLDGKPDRAALEKLEAAAVRRRGRRAPRTRDLHLAPVRDGTVEARASPVRQGDGRHGHLPELGHRDGPPRPRGRGLGRYAASSVGVSTRRQTCPRSHDDCSSSLGGGVAKLRWSTRVSIDRSEAVLVSRISRSRCSARAPVTASTTWADENGRGTSTIGTRRSSRMRSDVSSRCAQDDDVRPMLAGELDRLGAVTRLGDDGESGVLERESEVGPNRRVLLQGEHGWSCGLHWSFLLRIRVPRKRKGHGRTARGLVAGSVVQRTADTTMVPSRTTPPRGCRIVTGSSTGRSPSEALVSGPRAASRPGRRERGRARSRARGRGAPVRAPRRRSSRPPSRARARLRG